MQTDRNIQIDKRSQMRVKGSGIAIYSDADPEKNREKYEGQIVNMSPGGICICTQHELEHGSKVQLDIKEPFNAILLGIVRRCVKNSDGKYHVGLEVHFSNVSNTH